MKHLTQSRLQAFPCLLVAVLSFLICAGLGIGSLFYLANLQIEAIPSQGELPEQVIMSARNVPHALIGFLLFSAAILLLMLIFHRFITWKTARYVTGAAALCQVILSFVWKASFHSSPTSDQGIFWDIATHLAGLTHLHDAQYGYLQYWPFQTSGAMMAEPFARLFRGDYGSWQIFNGFCVGGCLILLCCICGRITRSPYGKVLCALLLTCFAALPMYTTFVYGTLPGMMMALLGIYAIIRQCTIPERQQERRWLVVSTLALAFAIILYTGEQIFLIAGVLVLLATGIFQPRQRHKILSAVVLLVVATGLSKGWQMIALFRIGMANEPGCPLLPRIAMGMDAFTTVTPGFYNNLNASFYYASNFDPPVANQLAWESLQKSLSALWTEGRFWRFLGEKTVDQWLEPWFGGLTMNSPSLFDNPKWLASALTGGVLYRPMQIWLSTLLSVVYLWAAVGITWLARRRKEVWPLSLAVCLIGGFLFQLVAEAKARYCLPYYLCCFPLAAAGLYFAVQHMASWWDSRKTAAGERPAK